MAENRDVSQAAVRVADDQQHDLGANKLERPHPRKRAECSCPVSKVASAGSAAAVVSTTAGRSKVLLQMPPGIPISPSIPSQTNLPPPASLPRPAKAALPTPVTQRPSTAASILPFSSTSDLTTASSTAPVPSLLSQHARQRKVPPPKLPVGGGQRLGTSSGLSRRSRPAPAPATTPERPPLKGLASERSSAAPTSIASPFHSSAGPVAASCPAGPVAASSSSVRLPQKVTQKALASERVSLKHSRPGPLYPHSPNGSARAPLPPGQHGHSAAYVAASSSPLHAGAASPIHRAPCIAAAAAWPSPSTPSKAVPMAVPPQPSAASRGAPLVPPLNLKDLVPLRVATPKYVHLLSGKRNVQLPASKAAHKLAKPPPWAGGIEALRAYAATFDP